MSSGKKIFLRVADGDYGQNFNVKESEENISPTKEFIKFTYIADNNNVGLPVLYSNKLITKEKNVNIDQIFFNNLRFTTFNGQSYSSISVYYNKKNVALLVEFKKNSDKEWFVRKDEVGVYWFYVKSGYEESAGLEDKLRLIESDIKNKISFLIDKKMAYSDGIELSTESILLGEFKKCIHKLRNKKYTSSLLLYKGAPLERMKSNMLETTKKIQNQPYESVTVYFGTKFKNENENSPLIVKLTGSRGNPIEYYVNKTYNFKLYWDKINDLSTDNEDKQLINRLKRAQFDLFQSVLILLHIQNEDKYDDTQLTKTINKTKIDVVKGKNVKVKYINNCIFLNSQDFRVYEHDFSDLVVSFEHASETIFGLRFFLNGSDDCSNLKLYNKNTEYANEEYIYYKKGKKKLYVFFYQYDPRPLLFYYNGQAFGPYSLKDYCTKWVEIENVGNFTCDSKSDNGKLLATLLKVTYSVNPVEIDKGTKGNYGLSTYITQTFHYPEITAIEINVICTNMGSYKSYTHKPGHPGYVLGEVSHRSNKLFNNYEEYNETISEEHKNKFPHKVSTYYHVNDHDYNCPLMLVLEYESNILRGSTINTSEYYKLTGKTEPLQWKKMQNNDGDREFLYEIQKFNKNVGQQPTQSYDKSESNVIIKKLNEIVKGLGIDDTKKDDFYIDYRNGKKDPSIPHPGKLNDDSNSGAVAGTITTLSLAGAGGGFLFYKYQAVVMSFIRGLFH